MNARGAAGLMARCCHQLAARGLIAGQDGNLSVRLSASRLLVTPSGLIKAGVTARDMVQVDWAGRRRRGHRKPTSELDLHLRIMRHRPDVGAVVHAHPPVATGFAVAGVGLDTFVLPELVVLAGTVPLVPYGTPGTTELGDQVEPYLDQYDALLLANHGAVTMASTLEAAWIRMESLEHAARILFVARALGKVTELGSEAVAKLEAQRQAWGRREAHG